MSPLSAPVIRPSPTASDSADLAFTIKQLQQIVNMAEQNGEWYASAIARYTLAALGADALIKRGLQPEHKRSF